MELKNDLFKKGRDGQPGIVVEQASPPGERG